jgi:hypothetical protein
VSTLDNLHTTFTRWLGRDYDLDAIDAVVAAAAAIRLDGDPVWILLVGGPGNAKTETVSALGESSDAHVVSSIASEGALLSGTSKGERAADATGGLLRTIGSVGVLVLKDFTSILSLPQSTRPGVLAGLREVYDGRWTRTIGADGGRTLGWTGRLTVIGAVTTAWDQAHSTVSAMGDRFVLLRMDSMDNRLSGGRQAIANTGTEIVMRAELSAAVSAVLEQVNTTPAKLSRREQEKLLQAANLVTLGRTAVMRDSRGNVADAHAPEMPTRFAKQLAQLVRGGVAIGMDSEEAVALAIRCARDSMPPLRLAILMDLTDNPRSPVTDVRKRLQKPHNTVDRELQALHMLGMVTLDEETYHDAKGNEKMRWRYSLRDGIDTTAVFPEKEVPPLPLKGGSTFKSGNGQQGSTSFSGNGSTPTGLESCETPGCPGIESVPGARFCGACTMTRRIKAEELPLGHGRSI